MQELEIFGIDICWRRYQGALHQRDWRVTPTNRDNCNVLNTHHHLTPRYTPACGKNGFYWKIIPNFGPEFTNSEIE